MVTESAGAIADRTRERLGTSDRAVIAFRKCAFGAARAFAAGELPLPVKSGETYYVRPCQAVRDDDRPFDEAPEIRSAVFGERVRA